MNQNPKSYYEGWSCDTCGAPLAVVEVDTSQVLTFQGEPCSPSTYACEGEERHRWRDHAKSSGGKIMQLRLIPELESA